MSELAGDFLWRCLACQSMLYRGLAIVALIVAGSIIYGYTFIPLRKVPGPWFSRIYTLKDWKGCRVRGKQLLRLHQSYDTIHDGQAHVIRLGPRLLSVQGPRLIKEIYGAQSQWRKPGSGNNGGHLRNTNHGVLHGGSLNEVKCRQVLTPSLNSEAIAAQQYVILNCADTALTVTEIACDADDGKVDVLQIARTYAFDVISW